ncbi:PSP1 C-terminal domain-containing protein, partial [Rhizobium ruizarguesonis]
GDAAVAAAARDRRTRAEILQTVRRTIEDVGVDMEVLAIDLVESGDDRAIAVYFRAPHRVEFATIVGPLARRLRARIDLRQLRGRDTA